MSQWRTAIRQFSFLQQDLARLVERGGWHRYACWVTAPAMVVFCYRHSRFWLLLLGPDLWRITRVFTLPLTLLMRPWMGTCEIRPGADIGPGLWVVHPSLGAVVAEEAIIGAHCTLTGGNVVGVRQKLKPGQLNIGDHAMFGVNAVVLGPVKLGNHVRIGAGAVVSRDAHDGAVLVGVPAAPVSNPENSALPREAALADR